MIKILLIQGANMNWLGKRQPEIYGSTGAAELDGLLSAYAIEHDFELQIFYTNHMGAVLDRLYEAAEDGVAAVVMNPGGFTHAGQAIKDCILGTSLTYVEVHISNHFKRGIHSTIAEAADAVVMGPGVHAYILGLNAALHLATEADR